MSRNERGVLAWIVLALAALPAAAQSQLWIRQLGTNSDDEVDFVAPDGLGGAYVGGVASGSLGGPFAGLYDAWFARYDGAGSQLWIRQLGTSSFDYANATAPDGSGGVYFIGSTGGSLVGPSSGMSDAWFARYDGAGNQIWKRQFGTSAADGAAGVAPDGSGGMYLIGYTEGNLGGPNAGMSDAWIARYDSAGNQLWIRQLGTSSQDWMSDAVPDGSGGVFVGGGTLGGLGGPSAGDYDAWFARYDNAGNQLWIRQLGTNAYDSVSAAAPDGSGGVYLGGLTYGNLGGPHAGLSDAWLVRYDSGGNQLWIRQFGTGAHDVCQAAAPNGSGGVYLSGHSTGSLGGPNAGATDAWFSRYDGAGNQLWLNQLGTSNHDVAYAAGTDGLGGMYIGGKTAGNLGGPNMGGEDLWLARYDDAGCPTPTTYCVALTSSSGCVPAMGSTGVPSAASPAAFSATGSNLEDNKNGLIFFGTTGPNSAPFFGGTLCVNSPLNRLLVVNSGGAGACTGSISRTLADYLAHPSGAAVVGAVVHSQTWFRDPAAAQTVGLTNGLVFTICP